MPRSKKTKAVEQTRRGGGTRERKGSSDEVSQHRPLAPLPRSRRAVEQVKKPRCGFCSTVHTGGVERCPAVVPPDLAKQRWLAAEDRLTEVPDGKGGVKLSTMRLEFPHLYPDVTPDRRAARQTLAVADPVQGVIAPKDWPLPCGDCGGTLLPGTPGEKLQDPLHPKHRHTFWCQYWDRCVRSPF